jgi:hypothetical protein
LRYGKADHDEDVGTRDEFRYDWQNEFLLVCQAALLDSGRLYTEEDSVVGQPSEGVVERALSRKDRKIPFGLN